MFPHRRPHRSRSSSFLAAASLVLPLVGCTGAISDSGSADSALGAAATVSFQNGVSPSGYAGTSDTTLEQDAPTAHGSETSLRVDRDYPNGTGQSVDALLRFDLSRIPAGSVVQSVRLVLNVSNGTSSPGFQLYAVERAWTESAASWGTAQAGSAWLSGGARGSGDRAGSPLGTLQPTAAGKYTLALNAAGVAAVQGWVNAPGSNHGFVIDSANNMDGLVFDAREAAIASNRPALEVTYATASTTPAPTGSAPPFDWVGVIGTGQSLSVGYRGTPELSTTQPFNNGKLQDNGGSPLYPLTPGALSRYQIVPLTEPVRRWSSGSGAGYSDGQYPNNIFGETPHSAMANQLTSMFRARTGNDYVTLHTVVGWSGNALANIDLNGGKRAYPASLMEAKVFHELALKAHKTYGVGAVVLTHGEADAANLQYGAGLQTFIAQYNRDLKAITGQTSNIPLIASQQSVHTSTATSNIQLWKVSESSGGLIVCAGPKYQYGYADDNLHLPAAGYRRLGEKYAEVFDAVVNRHVAWKPLQPHAAVRSANRVVITFDVPNAPLAWDPNMELPHQSIHSYWAHGRGFEVTDERTHAAIGIASAEITSADQVTLTLSSVPSGPVVVGYALTEDAASGDQGGLVTGFRGALRDSDPLIGRDEQSFTATVTKGSAVLKLAGAGLSDRALRDLVTGSGAPASWAVKALNSASTWTMYAPWTGASGTVTLKVHHDEHNYCVHSVVSSN